MKHFQTKLGIIITVGILATLGLQLYNLRRSNYNHPFVSPRTTAVSKAGQSEAWQVVRVSDGDTIVARRGFWEETIRFCGIDAPEQGQPMGNQATAYLQQLIDQAQGVVLIVETDRDRYGRMVGEVFTVGAVEKLLQEEMLLAGMAYVYPQYVGSCPNAAPMEMAEAIAQQNKAGVWSSEQQRPWEFRQVNR